MLYRGMEASLMTKDLVRRFEPHETSMTRDEYVDHALKISALPRIFPTWTIEDFRNLFGGHWDDIQNVLAEAKD